MRFGGFAERASNELARGWFRPRGLDEFTLRVLLSWTANRLRMVSTRGFCERIMCSWWLFSLSCLRGKASHKSARVGVRHGRKASRRGVALRLLASNEGYRS